MKKWIMLALLPLLLGGCARKEAVPVSELDLWVTSQARAEAYEALAESWNEEHPEEPVELNISVYSSQSIAGKFSRGFSVSTSFNGSGIPDLVELDYATFPEYVFQQTADLYPLQNLLDKHGADPAGVSLYSKNDICFGLPYHGQQLVLCCRLDLKDRLPGFRRKAASFEGLLELGREYAADTGQPLLQVDYLGSECFLALYVQALEKAEPEEAYKQALAWLEEAREAKVSGSLASGDAYSDSFCQLLARQEVACFVTTCANLLDLAAREESIPENYAVLGLPSFGGSSCRVDAPTVAVAVHMSGGDPVLSRNFLEYCRFSEAAKDRSILCLNQADDGAERLGEVYRVWGTLDAEESSRSLTASQLDAYLASYSQQVLGGGMPE